MFSRSIISIEKQSHRCIYSTKIFIKFAKNMRLSFITLSQSIPGGWFSLISISQGQVVYKNDWLVSLLFENLLFDLSIRRVENEFFWRIFLFYE